MTTTRDLAFSLSEEELARRYQCSWKPVDPDLVFQSSVETLRWAFLERFNGAVPALAALRARYIFHWHKAWGEKPRAGTEYWTAIREAVGLAARLRDLLLSHEVLIPFQSYSLDLATGVITGNSAVLQRDRDRKGPRPMVLDLLGSIQTQDRRPIPGPMALARWLAMRDLFDGPILGILHFPLQFGSSWSDLEIDEPLAKAWLGLMLKEAAESGSYPRTGSYCRGCPAPCKEILSGSNDRDRKGWLAVLSD